MAAGFWGHVVKPTNARHAEPNRLSKSAHQLFASAADNTAGAPVNQPYRPRTVNARSVA